MTLNSLFPMTEVLRWQWKHLPKVSIIWWRQPLLLYIEPIPIGIVMQCHNLFQIAESLSLFQSLGSMWCRCIKTETKDLSWSTMYVACTFFTSMNGVFPFGLLPFHLLPIWSTPISSTPNLAYSRFIYSQLVYSFLFLHVSRDQSGMGMFSEQIGMAYTLTGMGMFSK